MKSLLSHTHTLYTRGSTILLYILVFLIPLQTRWIFVDSNVEYWRMSLYGFDVVLILLLVLVIATKHTSLVRHVRKSIFNVQNYTHWIYVTSLSMLVLALISSLWAHNPNIVAYGSIRLLIGISLLWVLSEIKFDWKKLLWIFVIATSIQALLGTGQFLLQDDIVTTKWLGAAAQEAHIGGTSVIETHSGFDAHESGRWLRAHGTQPHPNALGALLAMGLFAIVYLIHSYHKHMETLPRLGLVLLLYIMLCIHLLGILFSFSRSAWIGISIIILFWLVRIGVYSSLFSNKRQLSIIFEPKKPGSALTSIWTMLGAGLVLVVVMMSIFSPLLSARTNIETRLETISVQTRVQEFNTMQTLLLQQPVLGHGLGNYTHALSNNNPMLAPYQLQPVHNTLALISVEIGISGTLLILSLIIALLMLTLAHRSILIVPFSFLIIISMFDHYLWTLPSMALLFWMMVGFIVYSTETKKPTH